MYELDADALETTGIGACAALEGRAEAEDLSGVQVAAIAISSSMGAYVGYQAGRMLGGYLARRQGLDEKGVERYEFWGGTGGIVTGLGVAFVSGKVGGEKLEEYLEGERARREKKEEG